jgi:hypothetical protein
MCANKGIAYSSNKKYNILLMAPKRLSVSPEIPVNHLENDGDLRGWVEAHARFLKDMHTSIRLEFVTSPTDAYTSQAVVETQI